MVFTDLTGTFPWGSPDVVIRAFLLGYSDSPEETSYVLLGSSDCYFGKVFSVFVFSAWEHIFSFVITY